MRFQKVLEGIDNVTETWYDSYVRQVATILARRGGGMTQVEILEELKKFTIPERLTIVEAALRLIREDLQVGQPLTRTERRRQLAAAAEALLPDYAAGAELTVFTGLDGEDFYASS
jgi:hypothetical protein